MTPRGQTRPVVGIPTQTLQSLGGVSNEIPPSWVMSQRYIVTLTNAGAIPWMIPLVDEDSLHGIYDELDAVFLPGGADIDPCTYGADPHPLCDKTDRERDRVEVLLAKWALAEDKPVLGVCRGMQLINVAAGGTLYQDLAEDLPGSIKHDYFPFCGKGYTRDYLAHDVDVVEGTRLANLVGAGPLRVNSMHHQGVRELGRGLIATAEAPDGLIEALEGEDDSAYLFAVQWHPEALTDSDARTRRLFDDFIDAGSEWRRTHGSRDAERDVRRGRRFVIACVALTALGAGAARVDAQAIPKSQLATVVQQVGPARIEIVYRRPVARGRTLFGALVPWGRMWTPSADSAPRFTVSAPVTVNGAALPAGSYGIWAVPDSSSWTIIFSTVASAFHLRYPQGSDALRVQAVPATADHAESLLFDFPLVDADSAVLQIRWGKTAVPVMIRAARVAAP